MKCPNCGNEIADGKLYCENCGVELQIVPDLDFSIESEMKKTMNNIVSNEFNEDGDDLDEDPHLLKMLFDGKMSKTSLYITLGILVLLIIVSAVFLGIKISKNTSYDYQLKMAEEKLSENDILEAVSYLEKANKIEPSADLLFDIADYYYTLGREYDAIYALTEITEGDFNADDAASAYRKLVSLYSLSQNYEAIAKSLSGCIIPEILDEFADYCVYTPEFNTEEGTYEQTVSLKITSEGMGNIYYSLDNTIPNSNSDIYDSPIYLEYGSYTVSAVYINKFGVASEVVTKKYLIDVDFVFEPDILTPSGEYHDATLIEAEIPVMYTMYYTVDGGKPDKNALRYVSPIAMSEGTHTYKFVMYATDGTESSVVERTYTLSLELQYTPADAVTALSNYLVSAGRLIDGAHREGVEGTILLMYSATYPIVDKGTFFFVIEYLEDANGNKSLTGNKYAVSAYDLSVYSVESSGGEYVLSGI